MRLMTEINIFLFLWALTLHKAECNNKARHKDRLIFPPVYAGYLLKAVYKIMFYFKNIVFKIGMALLLRFLIHEFF